ncbi:MAG: twin-arginine translocase TatA/TatE family subunit [Candidatus Dormiibacterota bacterium]
MFGLDRAWWVIPLILVIVLVIWGPGKLPEVGSGLGRAIREFRSAATGMKESVSDTSAAAAVAVPLEQSVPAPVAAPAPGSASSSMEATNRH